MKNKKLHDRIVDAFNDADTDSEGNAFIDIEDGDLYIYGVVSYYGHDEENYVTIDGHSYLEATYMVCDGVEDVEVHAWKGEKPIEINTDYIQRTLQKQYN